MYRSSICAAYVATSRRGARHFVAVHKDVIDDYELLEHPVVAGHGPTSFAGLREPLHLRLVGRDEFPSRAVALRYEPRTAPTR